METMIQVFPAQHPEDQWWWWVGVVATVGGAVATWMLLRPRPAGSGDYNRRMLLAMLCFFVAIMGAGTAGFSLWKMYKLGDVQVSAEAIAVGELEIRLTSLRQARITTDRQASLVNPGQTVRETRLLVLETQAGKQVVLSEDNYDVDGILRALRDASQ